MLAILIAIAVPAMQHWLDQRRRRVEDEARARSVAMSLLSSFVEVGDNLNNVWDREHPDHQKNEAVPTLGHFAATALQLPRRLIEMSDRLHELGPAALPAQRLVYLIERAKDCITPSTRLSREMIIHRKAEFYDLLWEATGEVVRVENRIRKMFLMDPRNLK